MLLYAVHVEEWDEYTWYETTKERYEASTDDKKIIPVHSINDVPDDLVFEEKRLNEVRAMIEIIQLIQEAIELAHDADPELKEGLRKLLVLAQSI